MKAYRLHKKLMGSAFELLIHHDNESEAMRLLKMGVDEIERIEDLLSEFKENTITTSINQYAGLEAVVAGEEVYELINRSIDISKMCGGVFDITVGPLKKLYRFKNTDFTFPSLDNIKEALSRIGYQYISLDEKRKSVKLEKPQMSLSFAAIGKGYAADKVKSLWIKHGVDSGVISASGDMSTIGESAKGIPWKIGIADPNNETGILFYIPLINASIATSGDYNQYFNSNGKRYSHNINPLDGYPITGVKSVSVISPAAELSDALATAVTVMGVKKGIHFINQLPNTHAIMIDDENKVYFSDKIQILNED